MIEFIEPPLTLGLGVFTAIGVALGATAASAFAVGLVSTIAVGSAAAGAGYTIASGEDAKKKQKEGLRKQEAAQQEAVRAAQNQQRKSEMAINQANRRAPDVNSIMQAANSASKGGPSGTMLTGPTGVDPNALSLGKSTLLGS